MGENTDLGAIDLVWLSQSELEDVTKFHNFNSEWFFQSNGGEKSLYTLDELG